MTELEVLQWELDTLRRRMRTFGIAMLVVGLILLGVGVWVITSPSSPVRDLDYHDVVTASA